MSEVITLAHGSGGTLTHELINKIFYKHFQNDLLDSENDAAVFNAEGKMAFTTDSFVITPVFFKGGNIGKISVCGTVNDLASMGAIPKYLSCGFIIEEGLKFSELERIVEAMAETAKKAGVKIVTGDTKVVGKGACDKVFINTAGIGFIPEGRVTGGNMAKPGDKVILTGFMGDHGTSILLEREDMGISADLSSDCAPLNGLVEKIYEVTSNAHVLRDPTRGGVATTLNEIASQSGVDIKLYEEKLPVRDEVQGICDMLGMEPIYMANEGKMLVIVPGDVSEKVLDAIRSHEYGVNAEIIGDVLESKSPRVLLKTYSGGTRVVDMLTGDQLPRIC